VRHSWGRSTGPWLWWGPITRPQDIGNRRIAARLLLDRQSGIVFNVATVLTGSLVLGWYPNHRKAGCVTGFGRVRATGEKVAERHYCWARNLDLELGPDPIKLRMMV
jgi:hypothetical protein